MASNSLINEVNLHDRPRCNMYGVSRPSWSPSLTHAPVTSLCWEGSPVRFCAEPISVTARSLHCGWALGLRGWSGCFPAPLCWNPFPSCGTPIVLVPLGQTPSKHTCFFPAPKKERKTKRSQESPSFVTISLWTRAGPEHPQTKGSVTLSRAQQLCTDKQQEIGWHAGISQVCYFYCFHYLQILHSQAHLQRRQLIEKGIEKEKVMEGQKHQICIGRWAWNFVLPEG